MANTPSAKKAARKIARRTAVNTARRSRVRTFLRRVEEALQSGDHQAAGFVAMDDRAEVPIHVIGPAHLVDRVAAWGWTDGLIPDGTLPAVPMDEMRGRILRTFSGPTRDTETRT